MMAFACDSSYQIQSSYCLYSKEFHMGNFVSNRINPNIASKKESQLKKNSSIEVSRKNFRFISKVSSTGANEQSIVWLAQNWDDPSQKFFVKSTSKQACHRHGRVESVNIELAILCKQSGNKLMIQPMFAFQDYSSLYLVHSFSDYFTLEEVIMEHMFEQDEAKYVIMGLINIIERLHQRKYALCQLNPKNIVIDRKSGDIKLFELVNLLPIDSYYPSSMILPLNSYSAPEILLLDRVLAESDYFSLGLIMYYIMKKKKPAVLEEIPNNRMAIVNVNIEVAKCDLPEGWMPEAADFLVKLLIKNPQLRLGRYGSFQVKNHPWLQNYLPSQNSLSLSINLSQPYFKEKKYKKISKQDRAVQKQQINEDYEFQIQFENYQYRQSEFQNFSQNDAIQEQF